MVVKESKSFWGNSPQFCSHVSMSSDASNLQQGACGGAWALQVRCFRRVNSGTAGVKPAVEFQQEEPEKSAPKERLAGGVSGEVGNELPISPPSPPMKHNCPAGTLNLESAARKASSKIPKIPRGGDSESPIAEGFTTR